MACIIDRRRIKKDQGLWPDWVLLECVCAQKDICRDCNCCVLVLMLRAGTGLAETAGKSKCSERVLAVGGGAAGNFGGAGADSEATHIQPGL